MENDIWKMLFLNLPTLIPDPPLPDLLNLNKQILPVKQPHQEQPDQDKRYPIRK